MYSSLVLAALLCWTTAVDATNGRVTHCCSGWSTTEVPARRIQNYTLQREGVCPIRAVMFHTVRGKTLCSNPENDWTKRMILKVDEDTKALLEKRGMTEESTSVGPPVQSPASRRTPGRRDRMRQRGKKQRRGRKGQRRGRKGQRRRA